MSAEHLKLGGTQDTLALSALAAAIAACGPYITQSGADWKLATGALAGFSGLYMAERFHKRWMHSARAYLPQDQQGRVQTNAKLVSHPGALSANHEDRYLEDALLLGYMTDTGLPYYLPTLGDARPGNDPANPPNDHVFITGMSGVGKTVAASLMMFQQIQKGGGVIFADGKIDSTNIESLWYMLKWCGREDDLVVIHPGDPSFSAKYNPILIGDPDEIASRIMSAVPKAQNSAGADFYRNSGMQAVSALVAALQRGGYAFTPADISLLLLSPTELEKLPNLPGIRGTEEGRVVNLFINRFRVANRNGSGGSIIDVNKVKELFGGIGGRMGLMGSGNFGKVANTTRPDVNLFDCIMQNKVIYLPLPTMGKEETAADFAKMFVGDYRTAVSWIQALPVRLRPNPPTLFFGDEPGSFLSENWDRLFEQARSARQRLMLSPQTKANLDAVALTLFPKLAGNCATKLLFQQGDQETAEWAADLIGMKLGVLRTLTESSQDSASGSSSDIEGTASAGAGTGTSEGARHQEMYRVSPDDLKQLGKGECVVYWSGKTRHHLIVPMIDFSSRFKKWAGSPRIFAPENPRRPRPYTRDYGIYQRLDQVLKADQEYINAQTVKKEKGDKK